MTRIQSDAVALAVDGLDDQGTPEREEAIRRLLEGVGRFKPHKITGLALRLLKSSNAASFRDPPYWDLTR